MEDRIRFFGGQQRVSEGQRMAQNRAEDEDEIEPLTPS